MGMAEKQTHWIAEVKIQKIERTLDSNVVDGQRNRVLDDLTKFVIKDSDLDNLIAKVKGHLELVDEEG